MKNKIIFIKIILFTLSNLALAQNLTVRFKKRENITTQKIFFSIFNRDSVDRYVNVRLEKFDSGQKKWVEFSSDVFSNTPIPQELTLIVHKKETLKLSFSNLESDWADVPKLSKKANEVLRDKNKIGLFKLKVLSGRDEFYKNEVDYSGITIIHHAPSRREISHRYEFNKLSG